MKQDNNKIIKEHHNKMKKNNKDHNKEDNIKLEMVEDLDNIKRDKMKDNKNSIER